jgi:hypothetical protein
MMFIWLPITLLLVFEPLIIIIIVYEILDSLGYALNKIAQQISYLK